MTKKVDPPAPNIKTIIKKAEKRKESVSCQHFVRVEGAWGKRKMCVWQNKTSRQWGLCNERVQEWGALPASSGLLASLTAASSTWLAAESRRHHLDLDSPDLFCKAAVADASAKPDSNPRDPLLKTAGVPPTYTTHLPKANRGGNWLLMRTDVWVPELKSPTAPQSVLVLTQPWGCSVWLPVVLKDSSWTEPKCGGV